MARTWEQEKVYNARRAEALGAEMDAAIEAGDRARFTAAFQTAMRYMSNKQRTPYFKKWLKATGGA